VLPITWWLWAYSPVWTVIREGQQSDIETYACRKFAPWLPISACVFGMATRSRTVWSSVVNMMMFGLLLAARVGSPRTSSPSSARQAMPATTSAPPRVIRGCAAGEAEAQPVSCPAINRP
jgi:hypothetical protein